MRPKLEVRTIKVSVFICNSVSAIFFPLKAPNPIPSQSFTTASFTQGQSSLLFRTSLKRDQGKMLKPVPRDFGSQRLMHSQDPVQQSQGVLFKKHNN